jgi:hypothetical protein
VENTPFKEYLVAIRDTGLIGAASIELEFSPDPRGMAAWVDEAHGDCRRLKCRDSSQLVTDISEVVSFRRRGSLQHGYQ